MIPENNSYDYWSTSQKNEDSTAVWYVSKNGSLNWENDKICDFNSVVRPVITISKSAITSTEN